MSEDEGGLSAIGAKLLGFDEVCARCGHDYGLHTVHEQCAVLGCSCRSFTRIKPEPSVMHTGDSVVFGDRPGVYEVIAEWPDPATLPPLEFAALVERRRAMQMRIIELLSIEVDVAKRVGSPHEDVLRNSLDVMLKIYAEDNHAADQEGCQDQEGHDQAIRGQEGR